MEKVLITGSTGYIGYNLIKILEKQNLELHLITRQSDKLGDHNTYCFDLNNFSELKKTFFDVKPDIVIHLAAIGFDPDKKYSLDDLITFNFLVTKKIADLCIELNNVRKFIYPTTYMECQGSEKPIQPNDLLIPQSNYAISKSLSSNLLLSYSHQKNLNSIILRLFSVYGENDLKFRFIPAIFDALLNGKATETSSCKQKRDFIHIDDVVNLIFKSLSVTSDPTNIYNVGSGKPHSLLNVVDKIRSLCADSKGRINVGARKDRQNEVPCYYSDISLTKEIFNWTPKLDLDLGLRKTYDYLVESKKRGL